jgi:predicted dehydrogenase
MFAIPTVYDDYHRMLAELNLDFVDIATRPGLHLPMVTAAADHGVDVLCQKPLAESMDAAQEMVQRCAAAGVQFMVNENYRQQAWFRQIRALLDEGRLGTPHYARFHGRWRATLPYPDFEGQDYFQQMPRLLIFEMGIHLYDTARYLFGEATSVFADVRRVSPDIAGEDMALSLVSFGDLTFLFDLNWFAIPQTEGHGVAHGQFVVEGSRGTVALERDGCLRLYSDQGAKQWQFPQDTIPRSFVATQQHFIDCLRSGRPAETSGAETLKTMALVFGAYRAAREGRVVTL